MITYTRFYFVLFFCLTSILGFAQSTNSTKKEAKELFTDATVIEIISVEDFNKYISGAYIRGTNGNPVKYVPREPTVEAQRQIELNTLDRKYADKLSNIELEMAKAKAIEDEELYEFWYVGYVGNGNIFDDSTYCNYPCKSK